MSTSALPTFHTAQQIADALQVDERTVLRWARSRMHLCRSLGRVVLSGLSASRSFAGSLGSSRAPRVKQRKRQCTG